MLIITNKINDKISPLSKATTSVARLHQNSNNNDDNSDNIINNINNNKRIK